MVPDAYMEPRHLTINQTSQPNAFIVWCPAPVAGHDDTKSGGIIGGLKTVVPYILHDNSLPFPLRERISFHVRNKDDKPRHERTSCLSSEDSGSE